MPVCEWCGEEFEESEAEIEFSFEMGILSYENVRKCLCGNCAAQAITDGAEGVYFETCEKCGKSFDFIVDQTEFYKVVGGIELQDCWNEQILCCNCALETLD